MTIDDKIANYRFNLKRYEIAERYFSDESISYSERLKYYSNLTSLLEEQSALHKELRDLGVEVGSIKAYLPGA